MRFKSGEVRVEGLTELQRALKEIGPEAAKESRKVSRKVAGFVADDAKSAAYSLGGVAAHVAPSIKPSAGAVSAGVALGGAAYPMALGAEFGGRGRPTTMQFQPHLGRTGYFVYPTIRRDGDRIESEYREGIDHVLKRVGLA